MEQHREWIGQMEGELERLGTFYDFYKLENFIETEEAYSFSGT